MTETMLRPDRPLEPHPRVIVVGASAGLGAALVRELIRQGYIVAALGRNEKALDRLCQDINATAPPGLFTRAYVHDVTDFDVIPALFQQIVQDLGGLDMIIYNAGAMPLVGPEEFDFAKDREIIQVNTLGAIAWLNEAARRFSQTGQGRIVGISSVAGDRGRVGNPVYTSSKAALTTYLEALRNRLSRRGVQVTTIKPGFMRTAMYERTRGKGGFGVISPERAAVSIIRAAERGRQTVYVPAPWALIMLIIRHIPSFIFRRLRI